MRHLAHTRLFILLLPLGAAFSAPAQLPRSPYYTARPGTARLTDARLLRGKFYYHVAPLSDAVSFYFYANGTASQQIIPASRFSTLTLTSRTDTATHYTLRQRSGRLFLNNARGVPQEVTRALFGQL